MKTKISQFEYAIRSVCEPQTLHNYEERTHEEELELRRQKLRSVSKRIKIKQ